MRHIEISTLLLLLVLSLITFKTWPKVKEQPKKFEKFDPRDIRIENIRIHDVSNMGIRIDIDLTSGKIRIDNLEWVFSDGK
jgi:hypothetical protein